MDNNSENKKRFLDRYSRQILFSPVGEKGQKKLRKSRVAVIGCGGLGSIIANNLTRAGVGFLRIIDRDKIEASNLQRQVLFDEEDVRMGLPKAIAAKRKLSLINSEVKIEGIVEEINHKNIKKFVDDTDVVLDGTDNFKTRFIINEACIKYKIPWIYGAVAASYGMIFDIIPGKNICLRCIFKEIPPPDITPSCNTVGIINSAVNVVASIQTTEALKILTGNLNSLIKGLINIDVWDLSLEIIDIKKDKSYRCPVCG